MEHSLEGTFRTPRPHFGQIQSLLFSYGDVMNPSMYWCSDVTWVVTIFHPQGAPSSCLPAWPLIRAPIVDTPLCDCATHYCNYARYSTQQLEIDRG